MPNVRALMIPTKKQSPKRFLMWTLLAGIIVGLLTLGAPIDNFAHMTRSAINDRPASGEIVIVKIDDQSLRSVGNWPWSRAAHAKLVDRLTAMGARQIAFDIYFAFRADPAGDRAFAEAIKKSGRVILPVIANPDIDAKIFPLPEFARHAKLADISFNYDFDNRVRQLNFAYSDKGIEYPTLATKLAGWNAKPPGNFPIDYSISPQSFPSVSAGDIISGKVPASFVAGKIALIGTTTDVLGDQYMMPRFGRNGGVYIHAIGAESLMRGRPLNLGWWPLFLLSGLMAFLALGQRSIAVQNTLLIGTAIIVWVAPIPLEANLVFLDITPSLLVLIVMLWHLNWSRLRNRSTVNEVSGLPNLVALRAEATARDRPLVVARLHNYAEIVSALPAESERLFAEQITSRLCVGASGRKLYHGDEGLFCWLAEPNIPLGHHLEAVHALFRSPVKVRGNQYDVMVSFGVDIGGGRAVTNRLGSALVAADEAEAEGIKWKYHDPARLAEASWKLSLLSQLDSAIDKREVWVAYQPKLDLKSGQIIGVEALARWTHPDKGPISPTEFIGAAEQHDRIERLTDFILDEAIGAVASEMRQGAELNLAVNLSARLLTDQNLPARIGECLKRHGLPTHMLTLELTETAALGGSGRDIEMLRRLQQTGIKISIDDYGTGMSTLEYLKKVPAAEIKIDQTFIKTLREHRSDRVMVQSTIALAHSLGRLVVAEGIEDRDTLELLTSMGCDIGQGFIIGRAGSLRSIVKRMKGERGLRVA